MTNFPSALRSFLTWGPILAVLLGMLLGAYLYFSIRVELRLMARRALTRAELDARCTDLVAEMETLRARLSAAESRTVPDDWNPQAVNLNRRGQVLRLHGKGRSIAEIASDLEISQGEVELLVKVHDWPAAAL